MQQDQQRFGSSELTPEETKKILDHYDYPFSVISIGMELVVANLIIIIKYYRDDFIHPLIN